MTVPFVLDLQSGRNSEKASDQYHRIKKVLKIQELYILEVIDIQLELYVMATFNRRAMSLKSVTFEEWMIFLFAFSPVCTLLLL